MNLDSHHYSRYYTYIKPVTKLPLVKTYGGPILTLITMAIFIVFAIKPTVQTISDLQKKIQEYKQANEQIIKKSADLSLARSNYQKLDPNTKLVIQEKLPNNPDLKVLIKSLEQTALINNASISALQIEPLTIDANIQNTVTKTLTEISFTFNVTGSYDSLMKILTGLYQNIRIISIKSMNINKIDQSNNLFMSINGKAYYLK